MGSIKKMVEEHVSGIYVKSLRIGNNVVEVSTIDNVVRNYYGNVLIDVRIS